MSGNQKNKVIFETCLKRHGQTVASPEKKDKTRTGV